MQKLRFDLNIASTALLCPNPTEFYSKAYLTEDVANNYRVVPGVKNDTKVATVLFGSILSASNCNWAAAPTTMSAVTVAVEPVAAMVDICRYDLESSFLATQMAKGAAGTWDVPTFLGYYWDEMSKEINDEIAQIRWRGDKPGGSGILSLADGYVKLISASQAAGGATAAVSSSVSGSVTSANVLTTMATMYNELPNAVKAQKSNLRFYLASNFAASYEVAAATGNNNTYTTSPLQATYLGIPIVVCPGMSNNYGVLTSKNNLIYAFDGEDDSRQLRAINLEDTVAVPSLRTRAEIKIGFQIVNPAEILFKKV